LTEASQHIRFVYLQQSRAPVNQYLLDDLFNLFALDFALVGQYFECSRFELAAVENAVHETGRACNGLVDCRRQLPDQRRIDQLVPCQDNHGNRPPIDTNGGEPALIAAVAEVIIAIDFLQLRVKAAGWVRGETGTTPSGPVSQEQLLFGIAGQQVNVMPDGKGLTQPSSQPQNEEFVLGLRQELFIAAGNLFPAHLIKNGAHNTRDLICVSKQARRACHSQPFFVVSDSEQEIVMQLSEQKLNRSTQDDT
jgi:hypothetical protein